MPYIPQVPDYSSGNATKGPTWIPELFAGIWVEKLFEEALYTEISTTQYNGEIKSQGDSVVIPLEPLIDIKDYSIGTDMTTDAPDNNAVILYIDKAKYFNVSLDDIHEYQSHLDLMKAFAKVAAKEMAKKIDTEVFAALPDEAHAANQGPNAGAISGSYNLGDDSAPITIDESNALEVILQTAAVLDEQNVPREDRWIVLPTIWAMKLKNTPEILSAAAMGGNESTIRANERALMFDIDGLRIYRSNNIAKPGAYYQVPFGYRNAFALCTQMTKNDVIDSEKQFAQLLRGLVVYGSKVVQPEGIGVVHCTF